MRAGRRRGAAELSDDVSRVHALLVRIDDRLHLIDAGSTNGTFHGERQLKCEPLVAGESYAMGRMKVRWEPVH